MEVVWTAKAGARLRELHDFIAKESPQRALAVVDRLRRERCSSPNRR